MAFLGSTVASSNSEGAFCLDAIAFLPAVMMSGVDQAAAWVQKDAAA
jgi:hypothetical protein